MTQDAPCNFQRCSFSISHRPASSIRSAPAFYPPREGWIHDVHCAAAIWQSCPPRGMWLLILLLEPNGCTSGPAMRQAVAAVDRGPQPSGPEASDTRNQLGHPPNRSRRNREPQPAHHDAKGRCTLHVELCWSAQRQSVAVPLPNNRQRPTFGGERSCSPLVGATLTACPLDDRIKNHDVSRSSATR